MIEEALAYARAGISIFPCRIGGKKPITKNGFHDATTDTEEIENWWTKTPAANIGCPCGAVNGFFVIDVELEGLESFAELVANQDWPATVSSLTGGGGQHFFFRWDAQRVPVGNRSRIVDSVDVRGEGGYVLLPPSLTKERYRWTTWESKPCLTERK